MTENDLKTLITDPRFEAMRNLLDEVKEELVSHVSHQATAQDHGSLAHSAGGVDCINQIKGRLQAIVDAVDNE
jgi:hypothetical protein|tara:strand:+ start:840 stop:1058 length:219 start_codon:yes stop_codon:yes gene_type:complete